MQLFSGVSIYQANEIRYEKSTRKSACKLSSRDESSTFLTEEECVIKITLNFGNTYNGLLATLALRRSEVSRWKLWIQRDKLHSNLVLLQYETKMMKKRKKNNETHYRCKDMLPYAICQRVKSRKTTRWYWTLWMQTACKMIESVSIYSNFKYTIRPDKRTKTNTTKKKPKTLHKSGFVRTN